MNEVTHTGITNEKEIFEILEKEGYKNIFKWFDPKDTRYPTHTHPYREVRWVLKGELILKTKDKEIVLKPGDKLVSPPLTPHSAYTTEDTYYICASKV